MKFHIRRAQHGQRVDQISGPSLNYIEGLDRLCFPGDDPYPTAHVWWWIVWDEDGEPVGFGGVKLLPHERGVGYLCRVGVLYRARGHKLQRRLIRAREAFLKERGRGMSLTYTNLDNSASNNNLIKCGYMTYNPDYDWAGRDNVIYWRKSLQLDKEASS